MKKLLTLVLTLALALSLAAVAVAAPATYAGSVTVNGTKLDLSKTPASTLTNPLPLRALVESDFGFAEWFPDEGKSLFSLDGASISVTLATGEIEMGGKVLPNVKAQVVGGVTFVPASVLDGVEGYVLKVTGKDISLTTPNADPLVKLARSIIAKVEMGSSMKATAQELEQYHGVKAGTFQSVVGFFPMMINADTVVIGKVAEGKMAEAKAALEAKKAATIQNFEQYLPGPLEMAKNGQVVTSGDYIMLIISSDNATAIQMFQDGVK